jgi:hypothetical protein
MHVAAEAHDPRGERIARGRGTFVEAAAPD